MTDTTTGRVTAALPGRVTAAPPGRVTAAPPGRVTAAPPGMTGWCLLVKAAQSDEMTLFGQKNLLKSDEVTLLLFFLVKTVIIGVFTLLLSLLGLSLTVFYPTSQPPREATTGVLPLSRLPERGDTLGGYRVGRVPPWWYTLVVYSILVYPPWCTVHGVHSQTRVMLH